VRRDQPLGEGDRLPPDMKGDLFFAEPVGRLIRRTKIEVKDGVTILRNPYENEKSEFIRSTVDARYYYPLTDDLTLMVRGQAGNVTGFDPQNNANYANLEAVQSRMGQGGFDLMYKLTATLPPGAPPP